MGYENLFITDAMVLLIAIAFGGLLIIAAGLYVLLGNPKSLKSIAFDLNHEKTKEKNLH